MTDWDRRYREGFYDGAIKPHTLLSQHWRDIPGRRVVDIAMGNGRDALFLAQKGFFVTGLERSGEAIKIAQQSAKRENMLIWPVQGDVARLPFKPHSFDGVTVFYFLAREVMEEIVALLERGGVLIYETYLKGQNGFDGPKNPDHLLDAGELKALLGGFDIILYEESIEVEEGKKKAVARAVGKKR